MKWPGKWPFVSLMVILGVIQLVPAKRTNPPVTHDLAAPAAVKAVLRSSCYDCHSNETRWPWYSRVAPVSWFVVHDVQEARRAFNFSSWGLLNGRQVQDLKREMQEEITDGAMPPGTYLLAHRAARLTGADLATLQTWFEQTESTGENP